MAITGYDGDPNGGGAPAILQGSPVGSWYLQETPVIQYRKLTAGSTGWIATGSIPDLIDIYLDPSGDDAAPGTATEPIQTLFELQKRAHQSTLMVNGLFGDGDYLLNDNFAQFGADTPMRNRFASFHPINLRSINTPPVSSPVGGAITILSYVDNVATVSETLPNDGSLNNARVDHLLFGSFPWISYVLEHTANSITFGSGTTSLGASFDAVPPVGAHVLRNNGARFLPPATNPTRFENGLFLGGASKLDNIDVVGPSSFDRPAISASYGLGGGGKGAGAGRVGIRGVRIIGAQKGIHADSVSLDVSFSLIDCQLLSPPNEVGIQVEQNCYLISTTTVIRNADTAFLVGANSHAEIATGFALYVPGIDDVLKLRTGASARMDPVFVWTDGSPQRYVDVQGNNCDFDQNGMPFVQQGSGQFASIFFSDAGNKYNTFGLSGAASAALIGTPVYVGVDGESFTLAQWLAFTRNVQTTNGNRVSGSGKTGVVHFGVNEFNVGIAEFGATAPVAQPSAIIDAAGGGVVDVEARTALNAVLATLRARGTIAP